MRRTIVFIFLALRFFAIMSNTDLDAVITR